MLQNELIKQLAEQAGLVFERDYLRYEELQFAELIINQCIDKIETYRIPVGNSSSGELACEWTYDALKEIRDDIKESFALMDNIKAGADINGGDGGYSLGTKEAYDEFVKNRSK
jgi:NADH:ubiquinone oxidoreductase subunit D